jgi:DNA-directed RNA polymerase subunit E'/Rpb7
LFAQKLRKVYKTIQTFVKKMYYKIELKDRVRVSPNLFDLDTKEAVIKSIKKKYDGYISKDLGVVIDVSGVKEVGEGVIKQHLKF